jgi:hypothetical protein
VWGRGDKEGVVGRERVRYTRGVIHRPKMARKTLKIIC